MVVYKDTDYTLYFEDQEIKNLVEYGSDLVAKFGFVPGQQETVTVKLKRQKEMHELSINKDPEFLIYSSVMESVVVYMTKDSPTKHRIYFEWDWFDKTMKNILSRENETPEIRWNGSGDKIFLLAGMGTHARSFKINFGD
jgi:hypothetical protein